MTDPSIILDFYSHLKLQLQLIRVEPIYHRIYFVKSSFITNAPITYALQTISDDSHKQVTLIPALVPQTIEKPNLIVSSDGLWHK